VGFKQLQVVSSRIKWFQAESRRSRYYILDLYKYMIVVFMLPTRPKQRTLHCCPTHRTAAPCTTLLLPPRDTLPPHAPPLKAWYKRRSTWPRYRNHRDIRRNIISMRRIRQLVIRGGTGRRVPK
jgi:hypothetical protein